jgi:hypothetical protein
MVLYVAAPLRPTEEEIAAQSEYSVERSRGEYERDMLTTRSRAERAQLATHANLERAMRWLSWLRRSFPEVTFIAPWIAAVLAGAADADEAQRESGLVDDCAVVERCDGIVLVGARVSGGMRREMEHGMRRDGFKMYDLTCSWNPDTPLTSTLSMMESLEWLADVAARFWR